jgi:hypothetical protein
MKLQYEDELTKTKILTYKIINGILALIFIGMIATPIAWVASILF